MIRSPRLLRAVRRANAVSILVASLLVCAAAIVVMIATAREAARERAPHDSMRREPEVLKGEVFELGSMTRLRGTPVLLLELTSRQRYSSGAYSGNRRRCLHGRGLRAVGRWPFNRLWCRLLCLLSLRRRCWRLLLRLEILKSHQGGQRQKREDQEAAEITTAAAATAASSLRVKIGIANFGQSNFLSLRSSAPAGRCSFYGNGSWGTRLAVAAGGTRSSPPRLKGLQRSRRQKASAEPRSGPCVAIATVAYSEHVGR